MAIITHNSEIKRAQRIATARRQAAESSDTQSLLDMTPSELDAHIDGVNNVPEMRELLKHIAKIVLAK